MQNREKFCKTPYDSVKKDTTCASKVASEISSKKMISKIQQIRYMR